MTAAGKEYGAALYELAAEESCEERILEDLTLAEALFSETPDYLRILQDPALPRQERLSLLGEAFDGALHPHTLHFLKLLCEKSLLSLFFDSAESYRSCFNEAKNILPVRVVSAYELTGEQKQALTAKLSAETGKQISASYETDASLIGGMKLCYNGKEADATVSGRLRALRSALLS